MVLNPIVICGKVTVVRNDHDHQLAGRGGCRLRGLDARTASVIWLEAAWPAVDPLDMRSGTEAALARVVHVSGADLECDA